MSQARFPSVLAVLAVLAVASTACGTGTGVSRATASPGAGRTSTLSTGTPASAPAVVLPGEPWFAYHWLQEDTDTRAVFLARPDGTDDHAILTAVPGQHKRPAWSPDGNTLAFEVFDNATPNGSIWVANADGTSPKLLFDGGEACVAVVHPSWSPDGLRLAMVCYPDRSGIHSSIAVLDIGSMELTSIATVALPEALDNAPRWSPDGQSLAFPILHWNSAGDRLDGSLIAVVAAAGGMVQRLTTFDTFMSSPDWRPDGTELVMNSYDFGNIDATDNPSNVYAIKPDGTDVRQLTHSSVDGTMRIVLPHPSADGARIYVSIATSIPPSTTIDCVQPAVMDAGGGEPTLLWASGKCAAETQLRPTP